MSSGSIRIIQLPEKSSVNTDDYMAVDSSANGTKKVKFTDLLDSNLSAQNKAADASATGQAISELNTDINTEALARQSTDNSLQVQIDQLVAPSGTAPNPAEIENARIGADGVTYDTLGNAIRTQVTDLKSDFTDLQDSLFSHATVSGTDITITPTTIKSAKATSANTTTIKHTGKNLLETPYFYDTEPFVNNGITFQATADGRIHIYGTATARANYTIVDGNNDVADRRPIKAGTYTWSTNCSDDQADYDIVWMTLGVTDVGQYQIEKGSRTFTAESDTSYFMYVSIESGYTVDLWYAPVIEKGSSSTEWSAYKGETLALTNGVAYFDLYDGVNNFMASDSFDVTYYTNSQIPSDLLDLSMFGAVGDGITDDTNAIKTALASAEGKILYIPKGTYLFSETLHVKSGTHLIGSGNSSKFKLADSFVLDAYTWRADSGGFYQNRYPLIATDADSQGCILENFALEGQTSAFKDENEDGICLRGSQHIARNLTISKINFFPDSFGSRTCITPAWGITAIFADMIVIENVHSYDNGYENFGIESSENVIINNCEGGDANQTCMQVHRYAKHCHITNCTFDKNNSCLTMDADPNVEMNDIHFADNRIKGSVIFVAGGENTIYINDNNIGGGISCNNAVYRQNLWLRGNAINGRVVTYHDNAIITDNSINEDTGYYMIIHHGNKSVVANNLGIGSVTDVSIGDTLS